MGLYDRDYGRYDEQMPPIGGKVADKPAWLIILVITSAAFLIDMLLFSREHQLHKALRADAETLFKPWLWWQWVTYAFAHDYRGFQHIIFNMIGLFFFGSAVEQRIGRGEFVRFYLVAAVLGGVLHSLILFLFEGFTPTVVGELIAEAGPNAIPSVVGASGSVMGLVILFCFMYPQATIYLMMVFPIKAWVAGILFAVLNLYGAFVQNTGTAFDVHLAGMGFAAVYYLKGWNLRFLAPDRLTSSLGNFPQRGPRLRLHDPEKKLAREDAEADRILQKIHEQGEASLTSSERKTLERYSRRMRNK